MAVSDASRKDVKTFQEVVEELEPTSLAPAAKRDAPKELKLVREEEGLYVFAYTAGGEVPDALKGKYTHMRYAEAARNTYEAAGRV